MGCNDEVVLGEGMAVKQQRTQDIVATGVGEASVIEPIGGTNGKMALVSLSDCEHLLGRGHILSEPQCELKTRNKSQDRRCYYRKRRMALISF